jgi:hypothetical protein
MRDIATVLLLILQLQPLAGAVVCLTAVMEVQQECSMPDHSTGSNRDSSSKLPQHAACPLAAICAPTAPAIPRAAVSLAVGDATEHLPVATGSVLALQEAPAPPFHPPRA